MWSRSNDTISFQEVELTCLQLSGLHRFPFLKIGTTFAIFRSSGTIPSCIDKLNIIASSTLIYSAISFNIFGEIPSTPGDLLSFIFFSLASIISGVITIIILYAFLIFPYQFRYGR